MERRLASVKSLILLHYRDIPAGGALEVPEGVARGGARSLSSISRAHNCAVEYSSPNFFLRVYSACDSVRWRGRLLSKIPPRS